MNKEKYILSKLVCHYNFFLFTLEPSHPPTDLQVYNVTSTSCEVRWGPVPKEHQNGVIIGYELLYLEKQKKRQLKNFSLDGDTYSYRLTGLDSYTEYFISVVGKTSLGPGGHGNGSRLRCKTEADCKYELKQRV